jgi:anti-anti-sigma factor
MRLSVHVVECGNDSAVVAVSGELDLSGCELLEKVLTPLVAQGRVHLVVKARQLTFCDVGGARVFQRTQHAASEQGGSLVIFVNRSVARFFHLIWEENPPGRPTVILAEGDTRPEARPQTGPPRRHVMQVRGVSGGRPRPHRSQPRTPARGESALERSRRLRAQAETQLEIMCRQVRQICNVMADTQERLAAIHHLLGERPGGSPLTCHDAHEDKAIEFRQKVATFVRT